MRGNSSCLVRFLQFSRKSLLLSAVVLLMAQSAFGTTLISNLEGNDGDYTALGSSIRRSKAQGFTLAAGSAYTLNSATMRLGVNNISRTMALELFGNSGGNPVGPALVTFTVPAFTKTGVADYTFTPTSPFTLQPSTTYWLTAIGGQTGAIDELNWMADSAGITPTGLATYAGARADNTGTATDPPTGSSSTINSFQINATSVPEPASMMTGLLGLILAALRPRRS